jgi:macrolide transport system ATP-binding/permease protein
MSFVDLRHACRAILRMPVLATVVVASLGVGIGVNTAVFSWVQALVLRPLPGVSDASSFFLVEARADTGSYPGVSWLEYRDLQERLPSLPELLAFRMAPLNAGEASQSQRTFGLLVSGNYFSALGLQPALGRLLRPDEATRAGGEPVVVISHDYWRTRFGGASGVLGRSLRVNDRPLTIVGVAPPRFQGTALGLNFDLWVPATLAPLLLGGSRELEDRAARGYSVMGRLAPSAARAQAQIELDRAMRDLARIHPETNAKMQGEIVPFWLPPRGPQRMLASSVAVLQGIMLLLLLAVCGNTANLLLARASTRQREIGVRLALGAGRWRVVSLMLAENLMLALAGAALGVAIAIWATEALRAVPLIGAFPIKFQTALDATSLAFAIFLGLCCGLMFGIAPALQLSGVDPLAALRSGSRIAGRSATRNLLMGVEVGLALVVLLAAAMFWRSFSDTRETDPGFRREGVLLANYDFTERNADGGTAREFAGRLLDRLRALPGVESAAIAASVPLDIHGLPSRVFTLEGRATSEAAPDRALTNTVTPGYFETMGIPLRSGTDFAALADLTTPPQAIVNEEFVRRYGKGELVGRRLESRGSEFVIAGVVANSLSESFGEAPPPVIYLSYRDRPAARGEIHLRTRAGVEPLLAPQVERAVRELDPALPVYDVRTLTEHVEKNLFLRRIPARMFVVLGPLLLVLAAIGIYASVAYTVSHRTTEIGVRLALGATSGRVVRQIVGETLAVIAAGGAAGWIVALGLDRHLIRGPLYLSVFAGVPLILLVVAGVACWLPARRAARVDPMIALRQEG